MIPPDPLAPSSTMWSPRASIDAARPSRWSRYSLDGPGGVHVSPELGIADAAELALAPDERLELLLDGVVELEALGIEHLEAVVVGGVVRGRDHDPGLVRPGAREECEGRCRDHADHVDVHAQAGRAGRDGRHEHVPRAPGVLADDDAAARLDQPLRGRPAEGIGHRRLEVDIRDTADPVGAEQA